MKGMPSVAAMRLSKIVKPNRIPAANSIAVRIMRNTAADDGAGAAAWVSNSMGATRSAGGS